ncbi:UDP-glucuronic acid decarboxylase 1 [Striga asiatica]|uniref:UDP-glucuronic acid decarboxylase 1 n=1 Tax=Striga asiatica TaxID=4170 RepID=A0A5A7P7L1_STRAF|nr:UDP-glucuronic acid decarboxylase 1 [Striga asiatica]
MHRGRRAGQMVDLIDFQQNRLHHIVPDQFEPRVPEQMHHVLLPPREEIVHHDHVVPSGDQLVHQMAPDETRAAGDDDPPPPAPDPHRNPTNSAGFHEPTPIGIAAVGQGLAVRRDDLGAGVGGGGGGGG